MFGQCLNARKMPTFECYTSIESMTTNNYILLLLLVLAVLLLVQSQTWEATSFTPSEYSSNRAFIDWVTLKPHIFTDGTVKNVAVVGNAMYTEEHRRLIDQTDFVIRCNNFRSRKHSSERTDMMLIRRDCKLEEQDDPCKVHRASSIDCSIIMTVTDAPDNLHSPDDFIGQIIKSNPHANVGTIDATKRPYPFESQMLSFPEANWGASTGWLAVASALQLFPKPTKIHVFGFESNPGDTAGHLFRREQETIKSSARVVFHPT